MEIYCDCVKFAIFENVLCVPISTLFGFLKDVPVQVFYNIFAKPQVPYMCQISSQPCRHIYLLDHYT